MTSTRVGSSSPLKMTAYESDLRTRLAAFPRDAHTWYSLGKHLGSRGRYRDAEHALRKAISLNPQPTQYWDELEKVLSHLDHANLIDEIDRRMDRLKEIEEVLEESASSSFSSEVSPCISCEHYTYYGCSKGQSCNSLILWRSSLTRASE